MEFQDLQAKSVTLAIVRVLQKWEYCNVLYPKVLAERTLRGIVSGQSSRGSGANMAR